MTIIVTLTTFFVSLFLYYSFSFPSSLILSIFICLLSAFPQNPFGSSYFCVLITFNIYTYLYLHCFGMNLLLTMMREEPGCRATLHLPTQIRRSALRPPRSSSPIYPSSRVHCEYTLQCSWGPPTNA